MNFFTDLTSLAGSLALIGFITEAVVEIMKQMMPKKMADTTKYVLSVIVGIVLCFVLQISLFKLEQGVLAFYVGIVICGLVASRGANYVHNFLGQIRK